jgi:hypothetical protein
VKFSRTVILIIGIFIGANLAAFTLSAQAEPEAKDVTIGPFTFHESNVVMWIFGEFTVEKGTVTVGDAIGVFCESVTVNDGCIGAYEITAIDIIDATNGFYGMMPVYGDDTGTPEKDGGSDGDPVTFKYYSQVNDTGQSGVFNVEPVHTIPFAAGPGTEVNLRDPDIMLPVELSAFNATFDNETSQITLKWRTESEVNNLGFDVYRSESSDGPFIKVNPAYIKGAGTDATPHDYKFVDESAVVGKTYYYYIEAISFSGKRERSHIIKVIIDVSGKFKVTDLMKPATFALLQNFPNPFNPETWIPFRLGNDADVTIRVFDIRGQEVRTIHLGQMPAGQYATKGEAVYWDGRDSYGQKVSSGIYFYNLTAGKFHATKKLTIIK